MSLIKMSWPAAALLTLGIHAQEATPVIVKAGEGCPIVHRGDTVTFQFAYKYKRGDLHKFHEALKAPDGSQINIGPGGTGPANPGQYVFIWKIPDDALAGKWRGKGIALVGQEAVIQGNVPKSPSEQIHRICFTVHRVL